MSYLDEQKRSSKAAPILLAILEQPESFNKLFADYREQDGIIDGEFLDRIPEARALWQTATEQMDVTQILALPLPFREAVFYGLQRDLHVDVLGKCLEATTERDINKRLKRILYEMKRKGVESKRTKIKQPVFRTKSETQEQFSPCFLSAIDSRNERLLIINRFHRGSLMSLQVYERNGDQIVHFHLAESSRKKIRRFTEDLRNIRKIPLFEIDDQFATFLLQRIRQFGDQRKNPEPTGFLHAVSQIGVPAEFPSKHLYHDQVDGQLVLEKLARLDDSEKLHEHAVFAAWMLDEEALYSFQLSVQDMETSGLLVGDAQKTEQLDHRIDRVVDSFFSQDKRQVFAERLRDAAYLLAKEGDQDAAITSAALALHLEEINNAPSNVPFFRHMLTKLLKEPEKENDQPPSGLIVP